MGDSQTSFSFLFPITMISPELQRRIDALDGCNGYWVLIRDGEPERDCSHQWQQSPKAYLNECLANRWRDISLGFVPKYIGFSDYGNTGLVGLANHRCFIGNHGSDDGVYDIGYGWNGSGVCIDVRYISNDMLDTIDALEWYPLISDDEHSQVETEVIEKDWVDISIHDRIMMLQDHGLPIFAARDESAPWRESFDRLREYLISCANEYPTSYA